MGSSDLYLSYTGYMKFKDCPEQYKLEYIDRERPKVQDARNTLNGNALHLLLERWMERGEFDSQWLIDNAAQAWEEQLASEKLCIWRNPVDDKQKCFDTAMSWAENLAALVDKYKIDPATCKSEFKADTNVKLGNHTVRLGGRIDILKTNKKGQKVILDLKCSMNRSIMKVEQLVWYATLVGIHLKNHDEPVISGWVLPGFKEVVAHPVTQRQKLLLMNDVSAAAKDILAGNFGPRPTQQRCFWCPVKHACPEEGGKVPFKPGQVVDLAQFI